MDQPLMAMCISISGSESSCRRAPESGYDGIAGRLKLEALLTKGVGETGLFQRISNPHLLKVCRQCAFKGIALSNAQRLKAEEALAVFMEACRFSAHVYHEEVNEGHTPPGSLEDLRERLELLGSLPCDWWVLELREEGALLSTLEVVRRFLGTPADPESQQSLKSECECFFERRAPWNKPSSARI